jgi:hypothetical protein
MWGLGIVFVAQALEIEKRMRARRRRQRWERIRAWMDKYDVPFGLRLLRNSAIALALFAAVVFLVGCAGHEAMQWRKPQPYVEECPVKVCEHWGPGKVDLEKDCNKCAML